MAGSFGVCFVYVGLVFWLVFGLFFFKYTNISLPNTYKSRDISELGLSCYITVLTFSEPIKHAIAGFTSVWSSQSCWAPVHRSPQFSSALTTATVTQHEIQSAATNPAPLTITPYTSKYQIQVWKWTKAFFFQFLGCSTPFLGQIPLPNVSSDSFTDNSKEAQLSAKI